MAWNPIVKTARFGKQWARNRRMHDYATSQEAAAGPALTGASMWTDYRNITAMPSVTAITDPTAAGQFGSLGINTTGGGTWVVSATTDNIWFAGSWVDSLTFTGAGSFALLHSIKISNTFRWQVVSSSGVT